MNEYDLLVRLILAVVFGSLIGWEREKGKKPDDYGKYFNDWWQRDLAAMIFVEHGGAAAGIGRHLAAHGLAGLAVDDGGRGAEIDAHREDRAFLDDRALDGLDGVDRAGDRERMLLVELDVRRTLDPDLGGGGDDLGMEIGRQAIEATLLVSGPMLIAALVVGLIISIFQAATQINEATLSFVPKLIAIFVTLIVAGPWMLTMMTDYMRRLYESIPGMIGWFQVDADSSFSSPLLPAPAVDASAYGVSADELQERNPQQLNRHHRQGHAQDDGAGRERLLLGRSRHAFEPLSW